MFTLVYNFSHHPLGSLRPVDKDLAAELSLKPGQKLCSNCKKEAAKRRSARATTPKRTLTYDQVMGDIIVDSDSDESEVMPSDLFTSPQTERIDLDKLATSLGCSPVKNPGSRDKEPAAKRKASQLNSAVKSKVAKAFDLDESVLDTPEVSTPPPLKDSADLDKLMQQLKEKVATASRREKIKLLTIVPETWSRKKVANYFGVTDHVVRRSRQLKTDKGILGDPDPKKGGRSLSDDIKQRVIAFYESEEYSRICPGKKEFVVVRDGGVKSHKQKQLLLLNLHELYVAYKAKYPNNKIGFSKFCELRPAWCLPVTAAGMHNVCVCQSHQNAKLLTSVIPGKPHYSDLLEKNVCSVKNRECMLLLCDNCPCGLTSYLSDTFSEDYDMDDEISYKQWVSVDSKAMLMTVVSTVQDFIEKTCESFDNLRQHHYISKAQASYLSKLKDELKDNEAIVLLDFAENYSFVAQDVVQSFHWNNSQATLHPFVVYFKSKDELKHLNLCVISDCLKHDTLAVHAFINKGMPYIKEQLPFVTKLHYFSDGCGGQYKNYKNLYNVCLHFKDFGIEAVWHFFATSHGKSPCDGLGGTVKRLNARASLQALTDHQILTAMAMFEWSSKNIPGIKFFFVSNKDVDKNAQRFDLHERWESKRTIPGTRSSHCCIPTSETSLEMKRISADLVGTAVGERNVPDEKDFNNAELQVGKYIACLYDKEWYIGCIVDRSDEEGDVNVNFMKRNAQGRLSWPLIMRGHACWVPFDNVLCIVNAPDVHKSARFYKLNAEDHQRTNRKFEAWRATLRNPQVLQ